MFGAEISQETQDQFRGNSQFSLAIRESVMDSFDHRANRNTAGSMGLRIEKDFGMPDVLFFGLSEISPREVEEITIMKKHAAPLVINVEEGLQIGKCIVSPDFVRRIKREMDPVPQRQLKHQLRLERARNMQVQLGLGHAFDEAPHRFHCKPSAPGTGRRRPHSLPLPTWVASLVHSCDHFQYPSQKKRMLLAYCAP